MRGKFISFEGPEGGGKSTHVAALAEALRAEGKSVLVTREPGGTRLAELIRGLVREELEDPPVTRAEVLLFLASRAQVVANVIKPALARGEWASGCCATASATPPSPTRATVAASTCSS